MKYIAFLRGINLGGKHKVPILELKQLLASLNCKDVKTLLNSGNVVFESKTKNQNQLDICHLNKTTRYQFKIEFIYEQPINRLIFRFINLAIMLGVFGLGIYTMILLIKALKIYISKNS